MTTKLLLIDDMQEANLLLQRVLSQDGYEVRTASNGAEGLRLASDFRPDLILLDIIMPGMDGWTVLRRLREFSDVPVIMLTALAGCEERREGLNGGADDYVTKPFSLAEIKARVRAVLRRAGTQPAQQARPLLFDGGRLVVDPSAQQALLDGRPVDLTPTEWRLLYLLASNAGRVLTSEQILAKVWGSGYEECETNVKLYIWYLRRKLEAVPRRPRYIRTRRGGGYYMADI
jgi:two-component system, OmpR family, KDP operon response regulator KdpE